jgi:hypothetical protein
VSVWVPAEGFVVEELADVLPLIVIIFVAWEFAINDADTTDAIISLSLIFFWL